MAARNQQANQNDIGENLLEPSVAIAALAFGFFSATTNLGYPALVRFFIFSSGLVSLITCINVVFRLYRFGRINLPLYRLFLVSLICLGLGYILSVSPSMNVAISHGLTWLSAAIKFDQSAISIATITPTSFP